MEESVETRAMLRVGKKRKKTPLTNTLPLDSIRLINSTQRTPILQVEVSICLRVRFRRCREFFQTP